MEGSLLIPNQKKPDQNTCCSKRRCCIITFIIFLAVAVATLAIVLIVYSLNKSEESEPSSGSASDDITDDDLTKDPVSPTEIDTTNSDYTTFQNAIPVTASTFSSESPSITVSGSTISYSTSHSVHDGGTYNCTTSDKMIFNSDAADETVFLVYNGSKLLLNGYIVLNKTGSPSTGGEQPNSYLVNGDSTESISSDSNPPKPDGSGEDPAGSGEQPPDPPGGGSGDPSPSPQGGGSDGDNYNFYGTNSIIVVCGAGSYASLYGVTLIARSAYSNAVVATGSASIKVTSCKIYTTQHNSRGLHATYSGTVLGYSTNITTKEGSCANLATDRGGGNVTAYNMTLSTAGRGSPLIYSTGDISVYTSTGLSTGGQVAVLEGGNTLTIDSCNFTAYGYGNRNCTDDSVCLDQAGVMIYQSQSGDASDGNSTFTATNSSFTISPDSLAYETISFFFVTNTNTTVTMSDSNCTYSQNAFFISARESDWGTAGSNGGHVTANLHNVTASTDLTVYDINGTSTVQINEI